MELIVWIRDPHKQVPVMSILLDALRKSEKDKHELETPDIHSEQQSGSASLLSKSVGLTALLVVVLTAGAWFVWQQYRGQDKAYTPPVTLAPDHGPVADAAKAKTREGVANDTKTIAKVEVNGKPADGQRTPVESFSQAATSESRPQARKTGGSSAKPVNGSGTESVTRPAAQPGTGTKGKPAAKLRTKVKPVTQSVAENANKPAAKPEIKPINSEKKFSPQLPEPISYWELPDAIRESLPEIKYSVLVYAKKTVDRFVLIDGQRYGHWDKLPSGAILKEIRRDGVVFKYRKYEFLIEN